MNQAKLEGYINLGQYGGVKTTTTGKDYTKFQLASGKGEKRQYFNCTVWHDEYQTERGVVDGKYAQIECIPKAWKKDDRSGVEFTVTRIWWSPEKPDDLASDDLPF